MLFAVGTRVKFLHTGDRGVVTGLLDGGMVHVLLMPEDMEIPAHPEDLIRDEEFFRKPIKAKIIEGKKEPVPPKPPEFPIETQYAILKSAGIQIAFLPPTASDLLQGFYQMILLNDTKYDALLLLDFKRRQRSTLRFDGRLKGASYLEFGKMVFDDLNEAPEFSGQCRWASTEGVSPPIDKSLKIKPKTFFSNLKTAPLLNKQVHLFRLFEKPGTEKPVQPVEDLKTYTKRNAHLPPTSFQQPFQIYDTAGLASFDPAIDLHIEKLVDNWRKLGNSEILRIQLASAESYLYKAMQLGVSKIYLIHGVGEGVLRDAIAVQLRQNPEVKSFINQYHHKYGWGATEVELL